MQRSRNNRQEIELKRDRDEILSSALFNYARLRHEQGTGAEPSRIVDFMNDFAEAVDTTAPVRLGRLGELLQEHGISASDAYYASYDLVSKRTVAMDEQRVIGRKLMYALSHFGLLEATVQILSQSLLTAAGKATGVNMLRSAEFNAVRKNLRKAVEEGNPRAQILEGKIAVALGDEEYAIRCFDRAMGASVAKSEQVKKDRLAGVKGVDEQEMKDPVQLSAPWYELALLHDERAKRETDRQKQLEIWLQWQKAIHVGVDQDDPTCFYLAAQHEFNFVSPGIYTSKWLHYVTKAAASAVTEATYDLGVYYVKSRWPYIDDEPPDELKPTPFDRYPVGKSSEPGILGTLRTFFVGKEAPDENSMDHVWQRALWPSTPEQRADLGLAWLEMACKKQYAPAFIPVAQLYGSPHLWASAGIPKKALDLDPKRYLFASAEEYNQAGRSEKHRVYPDNTESPPPPEQQVPNPHLDTAKAKDALREAVMAAYAVADRRDRTIRIKEKRKREGLNRVSNSDLNPDREVPADYKKWFSYKEVYESWEADAESVYDQAVAICNEKGWDLYDYDENILVKAAGSTE